MRLMRMSMIYLYAMLAITGAFLGLTGLFQWKFGLLPSWLFISSAWSLPVAIASLLLTLFATYMYQREKKQFRAFDFEQRKKERSEILLEWADKKNHYILTYSGLFTPHAGILFNTKQGLQGVDFIEKKNLLVLSFGKENPKQVQFLIPSTTHKYIPNAITRLCGRYSLTIPQHISEKHKNIQAHAAQQQKPMSLPQLQTLVLKQQQIILSLESRLKKLEQITTTPQTPHKTTAPSRPN